MFESPSPAAFSGTTSFLSRALQEDEVELGNTFLSATFVLALSRMMGLRELIIRSSGLFIVQIFTQEFIHFIPPPALPLPAKRPRLSEILLPYC
jgi:hypothetical protein